jgi:Mrp family chromosome partitioning ATPase
MSEPVFSVSGVLNALAAQSPISAGGGRAIMFIAARRKEGVTTAARAVALACGPGAVYALDLDLRRNALAKSFNDKGLGDRIDGRFKGVSFFSLRDSDGRAVAETSPLFSYHRVASSLVHVGVFDARALPASARVQVSARPEYWDAARACGATMVVDAPALERSQIGLRVAQRMDGVVLVVGADQGAAPAALAAKSALQAAGANLIGLVYAGASAPVMAMERALRRA